MALIFLIIALILGGIVWKGVGFAWGLVAFATVILIGVYTVGAHIH